MLKLIWLEGPISQGIILLTLEIDLTLHITLVSILHHHHILKVLPCAIVLEVKDVMVLLWAIWK